MIEKGMRWLGMSVLASVVIALRNTIVAGVVRAERASPYASAYDAVSSIVIVAGMLVAGIPLRLHGAGLIAGVLAGIASSLIAISLSSAPNPGYTSGVFVSQAAMTTVLSYYLLGSRIGGLQAMAIALVAAGVIWLGYERPARTPETSKPHSPNWFAAALVAAGVMSMKDLITKHALMTGGKKVIFPILFSSAITQALTASGISALITGRMLPQRTDRTPLILAAGSLFAAFHVLVVEAIASAPNAGYVRGAAGLGVALTALGGRFVYGEHIGAIGYGGIALILTGVAALGVAS